MSVLVYQAINAVTAHLAETGIAKNHRNDEGDYAYRSIDDVLGALAPLLARHKLCVLPRILSREAVRSGRTSQLVCVHAAFELVSALDGSAHTIESFGEALDDSDKGTAKATSAAFKSAMLQAFCIPVPQDDADATSPPLDGNKHCGLPEPPAGWEAWAGEVVAIASSCDSAEAIDRLTTMRRPLLAALQRSRPELYASIGEAIAMRLEQLQRPQPPAPVKGRKVAHRRPRVSPEKGGEQSEGAENAERSAAEAA